MSAAMLSVRWAVAVRLLGGVRTRRDACSGSTSRSTVALPTSPALTANPLATIPLDRAPARYSLGRGRPSGEDRARGERVCSRGLAYADIAETGARTIGCGDGSRGGARHVSSEVSGGGPRPPRPRRQRIIAMLEERAFRSRTSTLYATEESRARSWNRRADANRRAASGIAS